MVIAVLVFGVWGVLIKRGILLCVGACAASACGDAPAVAEVPPSWLAAAGSSSTPPWLSNNALARAWEYDSAGNSKREGQGPTRDGLFGGETGSPGAGGASPGNSDGFNLVTGCDVELSGASFHVCVNVFLNISPDLFRSLSPEQSCTEGLAGGAGNGSSVTPVANGCDDSDAIGVCTSVQEFSEDIRARYDTYHYAAETFQGEGCRSLL